MLETRINISSILISFTEECYSWQDAWQEPNQLDGKLMKIETAVYYSLNLM